LMTMDLFDQGADQGFPVQANSMFALDQRDNLGDMEGFWASMEYVKQNVTYPKRNALSPNIDNF